MHRLRPSVPFPRSERLLTLALLSAAQALFLWMFLAADAIEQRAQTDVVRHFASDWRAIGARTGSAVLFQTGTNCAIRGPK